MSTPTEDLIRSLVVKTYGGGSMPLALSVELARKIDNYEPRTDDLEDEDRERMIRDTCWNWFSGGGTANSLAAKIEALLVEAGS